jgi:hypothetical protein
VKVEVTARPRIDQVHVPRVVPWITGLAGELLVDLPQTLILIGKIVSVRLSLPGVGNAMLDRLSFRPPYPGGHSAEGDQRDVLRQLFRFGRDEVAVDELHHVTDDEAGSRLLDAEAVIAITLSTDGTSPLLIKRVGDDRFLALQTLCAFNHCRQV